RRRHPLARAAHGQHAQAPAPAGGFPGRALPRRAVEAHAFCRTTRLTPTAVSAMPATISTVIGSPNSSQAISAVVGGTRYMRLVTLVAAPRWISRYSSELPPRVSPSTDQAM